MRGSGEGFGDKEGIVGRFSGAEVEGFEATVGEPAVKGRGNSADCVLQKCEAFF